MKHISYLAIAAAFLACACSGPKGWEVSGNLSNAPADAKLALQGFNGANWFLIDSLEVKSDGNFAYTADAPAPNPDVYRLGYDGKNIYFPIDSIDKVVVEANAAHFDTDYALAGTPAAVQMMNIDRLLADAVAAHGVNYVVTDPEIKRNLSDIILADSTGVISYYLINKTIGAQPLYSLSHRDDLRMVGAVANKFAMNRPDDPRTKFLAQRFITNRPKSASAAADSLVVEVLGLFDISLYDAKGNLHSLAETADGAGVTLLSFTSYQLDNSPAYNVLLNGLYDKYKPNKIAIYQVAFDANEVDWMQAAKNLPWVAVRQDPNEASEQIVRYNITTIPVTFVIDGNGDIVERIDNPEELDAAIRKHL